LATAPQGPKILLVPDQRFAHAVAQAVRGRLDRLAVTTPQAVTGALGALRRGESLADLVYPPIASPRRALEQAGLVCTDGPRWEVQPGSGGNGPWLGFTQRGVTVELARLRPLERAAVASRIGPARSAGGHLLIGPLNYAGQGRAWARAVEQFVPGFTAANIAPRGGNALGFDADYSFSNYEFDDPVTRLDLALEFGAPATHVLVEDLRPVFGLARLREPERSVAAAVREIEALTASGRRVGILVHGSVARAPKRHRAMYPWSPFSEEDLLEISSLYEDTAAELNAGFEAIGSKNIPVFVSTLDMVDFVPNAVWLPDVARPADFAPAPAWQPGKRLRVAHVPSSDIKKGSSLVDFALAGLAAQGVIEHISVRNVPSVRIPGLLRSVDVVVDQVVLGNPGVLVIEAMAAGRVAVAHVADHVRRRFPEPLPVIEADPLSLRETIADIAADPDRYRPVAEAGPGFARRCHDGRLAAEVLTRHFLKPEAIA
jgi:hypothetical protein